MRQKWGERDARGKRCPLLLAVKPHPAGVNGAEPHRERRRVGLEAEVPPLDIHKLGVRDLRVRVHARSIPDVLDALFLAPLLPREAEELDRLLIQAPVKVAVDDLVVALPLGDVAEGRGRAIEENDVILEDIRALGVDTQAEAAERGDVVEDGDAGGATLDPDAAVAAVVADVVLDQQPRAPAVDVDAVADGIRGRADVVDHVVADHRAGGEPEAIDATAVLQRAHHVVDVIVLDDILARPRVDDIPRPPERDSGVTQVGDLVVREGVVATVGHEDAGRARMDVPAVMDQVVIHHVVMGDALVASRALRVSDAHAAATQVMEVALPDFVVGGIEVKPDCVAPDAGDFAAGDGAVARGVELQGGAERAGGLRRGEAGWRQVPGGVLEAQALEASVLHESALLGVALSDDEALDDGRDHLCCAQILAIEGDDAQFACFTVQLPLARGVAGAGMVLHDVGAGRHPRLGELPHRRSGERDDPVLWIHRLEREVAIVPAEGDAQLDIGEVRPRLEVASSEGKAIPGRAA